MQKRQPSARLPFRVERLLGPNASETAAANEIKICHCKLNYVLDRSILDLLGRSGRSKRDGRHFWVPYPRIVGLVFADSIRNRHELNCEGFSMSRKSPQRALSLLGKVRQTRAAIVRLPHTNAAF